MAAQVESATTATPPAVFKLRPPYPQISRKPGGGTGKTARTPGIFLAAMASKLSSLSAWLADAVPSCAGGAAAAGREAFVNVGNRGRLFDANSGEINVKLFG